jgi:hypothetical protein
MSDQTKTGATRSPQRTAWQRPEVRAMNAGAAASPGPTGTADSAAFIS